MPLNIWFPDAVLEAILHAMESFCTMFLPQVKQLPQDGSGPGASRILYRSRQKRTAAAG